MCSMPGEWGVGGKKGGKEEKREGSEGMVHGRAGYIVM